MCRGGIESSQEGQKNSSTLGMNGEGFRITFEIEGYTKPKSKDDSLSDPFSNVNDNP
jgi:hypothetical protein